MLLVWLWINCLNCSSYFDEKTSLHSNGYMTDTMYIEEQNSSVKIVDKLYRSPCWQKSFTKKMWSHVPRLTSFFSLSSHVWCDFHSTILSLHWCSWIHWYIIKPKLSFYMLKSHETDFKTILIIIHTFSSIFAVF